MARSHWDGYLGEAAALRDQLAGRLDLRVGVEAHWLPGTISFGSDAHGARQLGLGWDAARAALARMGVRRLITFERREPQWWTLE